MLAYLRTLRAATPATPEIEHDRQSLVRRSLKTSQPVQTLWASRPLQVRAGRLVAVRLRGEELTGAFVLVADEGTELMAAVSGGIPRVTGNAITVGVEREMANNDEKATVEERAELRREMAEYLALNKHADAALGMKNWMLVRSYGRIMSGPYTGHYVSALPFEEARRLLDELLRGRRIDVHLMHRHRSGNYESSTLSFAGGRLTMHFANRDEMA